MAAPTPSRFGLPRAGRLQRPRAFEVARREGRRTVSRSFILNWLSVPGQPGNRLGVVTSGKLGGAVVRNRARRILREVYRRHQHAVKGPVDLVLVARAGIRGLPVHELEREYLSVLRRHALLEREP